MKYATEVPRNGVSTPGVPLGGNRRLTRRTFLPALLAFTVSVLVPTFAQAGSATWDTAPATGDWNTATNWSPTTVPNASTDTATFGQSNTTGVSISADTEVNGIVFNSGASAYTITASPTLFLTISGVGITNNSGVTQNFVTGADSSGDTGIIDFSNSATAGSMTVITNNGAPGGREFGGLTEFENNSTADTAAIINNGATASGNAGLTVFFDTSTAAGATITNNAATVTDAPAGETDFEINSTAGTATIINNGATASGNAGATTAFTDNSTAGTATLIANGGTNGGGGGGIAFFADSTGGTARVEVFGNGNLDISGHNAPGVTIGSIEGTGEVFLGANNLTVGSNNLSTTFAGVIQDEGIFGGTGGSLTKIGTGTLSLTNANTYTGGTLINAGTLVAAHDGALGSGNVSLTASGVTLTLQTGVTNNYIADGATISIASGATANLNFTGSSDVVGGIVLNGLTETAPGTYGSTSSGATFQSAFFSGTGTLFLVPEPSTWTLIGFGAAMLGATLSRRRLSLREMLKR